MHAYLCLTWSETLFLKSNFLVVVRPKKEICVFPVTSSKKLGYFLFFSEILYIIFPDFNKKHNICVVCPKYLLERGLFVPVT